MIKQPGPMREYLIRVLGDALDRFRRRASDPELEADIYDALGGSRRADLMVALIDLTMEHCGAVPAQPKEPRFSKTRRALNKQTPKGPRGVPRKQRETPPQSVPAHLGEPNATA